MTTAPPDLTVPHDRLSWTSGFAQVLRLSAPIVPAMLAQMLIGFFDIWMVSQIGVTGHTLFGWTIPLDTVKDPEAAKAALAAVTPAAFMCWAMMSIFVGTVNAVSTFAAQAEGRGNAREAGRYAWQAVHFAALTLIVVATAWTISPWMFGLFAPSEAVLANEVAYFNMRIWSLPTVVVFSGLSAFFQGVHRPIVPAVVGVGANVVNLVLNWGLIYGRLGLPRMEMAGAGLASVISSVLSMAVLAGFFLSAGVSGRYGTRRGWRPSAARLGRLIWIGTPGGLSWLLDMIGWSLLIIVLVQPLGESEAAASNAAMTYLQIGFMPVVGVGIALTALTGRAIGRRRPDHARRFTVCAFALGGGYQLLVGVLLIVFRHPLIEFFNPDPRVVQLGGYALICAGVFQFFDAMGIIYNHALRGAGDTHFILITHVLLIGGLFIPSSWLATRWLAATYWPEYQSIAPWVTGTIYVILLGLVFLLRWKGRWWERINIFGDAWTEPAAVPRATPSDCQSPGASV